MAKVVQIERFERSAPLIDPELKDFIDLAIVPALVRQYLAEMDSQNKLANSGERVSQFVSSAAASTLRGEARP